MWDPTSALQAIKAALVSANYFAAVQIGEPFNPVIDSTAAIYLMAWSPSPKTTLSKTIDIWTVMVRIYHKAGFTPVDADAAELDLALGVAKTEAALGGGYTLGGIVRAIDWAGEEEGHHIQATWGHIDLSGTKYRAVEMLVPLIVDDSVTFSA